MTIKDVHILVEEINNLNFKANEFESFFLKSVKNWTSKPTDKQAHTLITLYERATGFKEHEQSQII